MSEKQFESMEDYIKSTVDNGYHKPDAEPIKCFKCESTDLSDHVTDSDGGYVNSKYRHCNHCKTYLGEWSYGNWQW